MELRTARAVMQLATPYPGNDVRKVIRELARVAGVRRVAPGTKVPRLLTIDYDPRIVQAPVLAHLVRRGLAGARLI